MSADGVSDLAAAREGLGLGTPPMTTMVERVARALTQAAPHRIHGDYHLTDEEYVERHWRSSVRGAKAAIAAMREPTDAMTEAGHTNDYVPPDMIWRAMLDAALAEGAPSD